MTPGMPFDEAIAMFPDKQCYAGKFCSVNTTIANTPAVLQVDQHDELVDQVYVGKMDSSNFNAVIAGFKQKYGEPDEISTLSRQNGMGAKFECPVYTWMFPTGKLIVSIYLEKRPIDKMNPRIEMDSTNRIARQHDAEKKAASDL